MKLAIVTNILTPYRIPLFEEMRNHVDDLKVFLMADKEENRQWQLQKPTFSIEIIPGFHWKPLGRDISVHWNYGLVNRLRQFSPDVILSGGFAPANLEGILYCKLYGKRYCTWGEVSTRDGVGRFSVRMLIRQLICRLADGAIASSSEAKRTFLSYGVASDRLMTCMMPIPVLTFHDRVSCVRQSEEFPKFNQQFSSPALLFVGQITERKGIAELFAIYESVVHREAKASLLIVGDGPDRTKWEEYAERKGFQNVHFLGFVQFDQLPKFFAVADIFLFPTLRDPLGAVLIEAMAAKVPAVSSIYAAATTDLIEDGVTGFRIDPRQVDLAAEVVLHALKLDPSEKDRMVNRAYQRVLSVDVRPGVQTMIQFLVSLTRQNAPAVMDTTRPIIHNEENTASSLTGNSLSIRRK